MTLEATNNTTVTHDDKKKSSPPYISFLTFNNMITWLESEGVPVKFDRSFWGKKFGGTLGLQLIAGLRFLGLLKDELTQPLLGEIVKAKGDERKNLLADMIQRSYTFVDFSQLSAATSGMLKEWFANYHLDGSTERKARSFFINACKAYGINLSNTLKKTARNKQTGITREKKTEKEKVKNPNEGKPDTGYKPPPPIGEKTETQDLYKIILSDGCELKLCSTKVFFEFEKVDRELIENIVETMKKYRYK